MRSLAEWITVDTEIEPQVDGEEVIEPNVGFVHDVALEQWVGIPYAQLSVILVHLRFLAMLHQTHHWISRGDSYYGDHLLFERLYNDVVSEIDDVAERSIGVGGEQNVNLALQCKQILKLVLTSGAAQTIPNANDLAKSSLEAEQKFMCVIDAMLQSLKDEGCSTNGIDNLLQGIADKHEQICYLLKRRCQRDALGM